MKCIKCGQLKANDQFTKHAASKTGHRGDCKECRNKRRLTQKKESLIKAKMQMLQQMAAREEVAHLIAAPRTFNYMNTVYVPEVFNYRNDGLKQIKSRGV